MQVLLTFGKIQERPMRAQNQFKMVHSTHVLRRRSAALLEVAFLILTLSFLACQSSRSTQSESRSLVSVPRDFRLVIGEGGGFTGQWTGFTVDSSGAIFSWRGQMAEQSQKQYARFSSRRFNELWQKIADAHFFDIDTSGTGNMTQFMIVSANGKVHRTSWAKASETDSPNTPVQCIYDSCRAIIGRER